MQRTISYTKLALSSSLNMAEAKMAQAPKEAEKSVVLVTGGNKGSYLITDKQTMFDNIRSNFRAEFGKDFVFSTLFARD